MKKYEISKEFGKWPFNKFKKWYLKLGWELSVEDAYKLAGGKLKKEEGE